MTEVIIYDGPSCAATCVVAPDMMAFDVFCPNCNQESTATPDSAADFPLLDPIPFFKSGKLEILREFRLVS